MSESTDLPKNAGNGRYYLDSPFAVVDKNCPVCKIRKGTHFINLSCFADLWGERNTHTHVFPVSVLCDKKGVCGQMRMCLRLCVCCKKSFTEYIKHMIGIAQLANANRSITDRGNPDDPKCVCDDIHDEDIRYIRVSYPGCEMDFGAPWQSYVSEMSIAKPCGWEERYVRVEQGLTTVPQRFRIPRFIHDPDAPVRKITTVTLAVCKQHREWLMNGIAKWMDIVYESVASVH